ncbi:hypothetical protein [Sulfobacillus thermosulfidooxidans]|uniref:hypothetical protein n=1 Tax=Sulfobacillus thermosulfidooxidans TaxID=28034 RepID=UPI0006B5BAD2|nr:hypothetical protein [Sulfobacillus thermosulfidooxidans]
MKHVVSVSLGSAARDHDTELEIFGEKVHVSRRGTNGDLERAREMIHELDNHVDAIGLGGIDRYLVVNGQRYEIEDAKRLASVAQATPVVDGSGVKAIWEYDVINQLTQHQIIHPPMKVLLVSALDRFGMARAFYENGFETVAGDFIFASHIDYPIRSLAELEKFARRLLPDLTKMPFSMLYPTGREQEQISGDSTYHHYFADADIIAGDFHFIRRHLPQNLSGKLMITNTTTSQDRDLLKERSLKALITTTPVLYGRSFGTNVIEAAIVAVTGVHPEDSEWAKTILDAGLRYDFTRFD